MPYTGLHSSPKQSQFLIDHFCSGECSMPAVPTQILAEAFRAHGYDGLMYRSLLGDGLNDQCNKRYFIRKHYKEVEEQSSDAPKG
jgi:hypothetical protein